MYTYIYIYTYTHTHICFLSIPSHQNVSSENFVWYAPGQWIGSRWTVTPGQQWASQPPTHSNMGSSLPRTLLPATPAGPLPQPPATCWSTPNSQWRFIHSVMTSSGTTRAPGMPSRYTEQLKVMSRLVRAWQNVVHWRREWQTTSVFLPWEPCKQYENNHVRKQQNTLTLNWELEQHCLERYKIL